jgi:plasmid stability protein
VEVPTLHIRNVPPKLYDALKLRANLSGRSLNAEVIATLDKSVGRRETGEEFLKKLKRVQVELRPGDPLPEDVIREHRDAGSGL